MMNAEKNECTEEPMNGTPKIAYFSMEIGIDERIPSYSGGLGVLAGDSIKSCADLHVPLVGITLLSEKGYFYQKIDENGNQIELPIKFNPEDYLTLLPTRTKVQIEGRDVLLKCWLYEYYGISNYIIPVLFLDANVEENSDWDRDITKYLYGGDKRYRLAQEIILGIGGVRMIHTLGYDNINRYHMNEGHAALGTLELYHEFKDVDIVRDHCVFTTHTPVAAGHDQFDLQRAQGMIGSLLKDELLKHITYDNKLNMTKLALYFSHYVNGVAKKHGEVSRLMFPGYSIDSITNGVHSQTWVSKPFKEIFDEHIPGWKSDPFLLRSAFSIDKNKLWYAHMKAKYNLIDFVNLRSNVGMNYDDFTIGFARRATEYKRPDLLISDLGRLNHIAESIGPIQIIYAGKAHPNDTSGKESIKNVYAAMKQVNKKIKIAFVPNYGITLAKLLTAGVDLWLNTPRRPYEASGTSGMKAAHNGVPQFGTLDGWWIEGHIENITGWSLGSEKTEDKESDDESDREDLYHKLETFILPKFYHDRDNWIRTMRSSIAINASFFNTHRMIQQYVLNAYFI